MLGDQGHKFAIPDFAKGALLTAALLLLALAFASHKSSQEAEQNRSSYSQVIGPASKPGMPEQVRKADQGQGTVAEQGPLDALGGWLLDMKLSDFLLILFTAILAWKTAGLDESTRRLWKAGEDQRILSERIAGEQARDTRESLRISSEAAVAARHSANVAEASLIAAERPWIAISAVIPNESITFDINGIRIGVLILMKNHGKTPASMVMPSIEVGGESNTVEEGMKRFCQAQMAKHMPADGFGQVIFPGETQQQGLSFYISRSVIDTYIESGHQSQFSIIHPNIFLCVDYYEMMMATKHQTGLVFHIYRKTDTEVPSLILMTPAFQPVPVSDIVLQTHFSGSFAN